MDVTTEFELERPRLVRLAARLLSDQTEAEDVVQTAWLRLHGTSDDVHNLPGWLTTVTTRICLDRLRSRNPVLSEPTDGSTAHGTEPGPPDPADELELAEALASALRVVVDTLTPAERITLVLHDAFDVEHRTLAQILGRSEVAVRKLLSRARAKIARDREVATVTSAASARASDESVVDAFLTAARAGDFDQLLALLAPDAVTVGDAAAVALGTPAHVRGRTAVATLFNGAAKTALPLDVDGRAGAAWIHRGEVKVVFDFTLDSGRVRRIDFRADPALLARVGRSRPAGSRPPVTPEPRHPS